MSVRYPLMVLSLLMLLALPASPNSAAAQSLPVGDLREEQLKIQQLLHGSELSSFTSRPVWQGIYDEYMDLAEGKPGWWNRRLESPEYELSLESPFNIPYRLRFGIFEPVFTTTTNSRHPQGHNNAAAWYGKGLNTELQGGFYVTSDYVTAMFRPHMIWQQNTDFVRPRFIPINENGEIRYVAEAIGDRIDQPFRFGPDAFWTGDIGHSSIRLHVDAFEIGYSTEPLWWGGNVQYPLVMSNNAPGMQHLFVGTREPFHIPYLGAIEFRWMGGWPKDSGYFDQGEPYQRDRFMNAANFTLSPAFMPDLHLGLTRTFHSYLKGGSPGWTDVFVMFDPFHLKNIERRRGRDRTPRNEINSYYARWVWPEAQTEVYGEFYREDYSWDSRDFMMEPRHNAGYSFGFQSLFSAPLATWYRVNLEFTNMTPSAIREVRPQFYYYTHDEIRQGHTHRGQLLGAAIGPGSNSQYLSVDALTENGRVGLFVRRLANNNHFHYEYDRSLNRDETYGNFFLHRTDLTFGGRFLTSWNTVHISGQIAWTRLYNYGRFDYWGRDTVNRPRISDFLPQDLDNIQMQLTLRYLF